MDNCFKILLIFLLALSLIQVLFYSKNSLEAFENIIDCSKCKIMPNDNNCIKVYDISFIPISNKNNPPYDISNLLINDTSMIFCPWKEQCSKNTFFNSAKERLNTDYECCKDSSFYDTYTTRMRDTDYFNLQKSKCRTLESIMLDLSYNNPKRYIEISNDNNYIRAKNICNQKDMSGMILKLSHIDILDVIKDSKLSIDDILDYQNNLTIKNDSQLNELGLSKANLTQLNKELATLDINNTADLARKNEIQNQLPDFFISKISTYKKHFNPLNKYGEQLSDNYLISSDQFFNCFGEIKNPSDLSLGDISINEMYNKHQRDSFFDTANDSPYKTVQDYKNTPYPSYNDYEMELKSLNNLNKRDIRNSSNNKNIIKNYLQYINSFYSHINASNNQNNNELKLINNELIISNPLKNVSYDTSYDLNCTDSITGNSEFSYCGPTPYNS